MTELDPHGTPPNEPGAKLDAGKTRAGLVLGGFARAGGDVPAYQIVLALWITGDLFGSSDAV